MEDLRELISQILINTIILWHLIKALKARYERSRKLNDRHSNNRKDVNRCYICGNWRGGIHGDVPKRPCNCVDVSGVYRDNVDTSGQDKRDD